MSSQYSKSELEKRKKKAEEITANPNAFKVCEGCESIVLEKAIFCPNCNSYRFDSSEGRVIAQALILGSRLSTSISAKDFE